MEVILAHSLPKMQLTQTPKMQLIRAHDTILQPAYFQQMPSLF